MYRKAAKKLNIIPFEHRSGGKLVSICFYALSSLGGDLRGYRFHDEKSFFFFFSFLNKIGQKTIAVFFELFTWVFMVSFFFFFKRRVASWDVPVTEDAVNTYNKLS